MEDVSPPSCAGFSCMIDTLKYGRKAKPTSMSFICPNPPLSENMGSSITPISKCCVKSIHVGAVKLMWLALAEKFVRSPTEESKVMRPRIRMLPIKPTRSDPLRSPIW